MGPLNRRHKMNTGRLRLVHTCASAESEDAFAAFFIAVFPSRHARESVSYLLSRSVMIFPLANLIQLATCIPG